MSETTKEKVDKCRAAFVGARRMADEYCAANYRVISGHRQLVDIGLGAYHAWQDALRELEAEREGEA